MSTKALEGIKVLDFTHVQAGPACTQLLGQLGADVIKCEMPGSGDATRDWLRDVEGADSLYFTMFNGNKRAMCLNARTAEGKDILTRLIKQSDVMVENFAPGALDRMGFSWENIQKINPGIVLASVKGYAEGHANESFKVYENVAQCTGGAASTTGFWDGPPTVSGAALGDSNSGMHLCIGILAALQYKNRTGRGQKVNVAMQDSVLNLCRVKLRDQQRLERTGKLDEYPHNELKLPLGDSTPRGGNAGGGGQPGWVLKCKPTSPDDTNNYVYFTVQASAWAKICDMVDKPEWKDDPNYNTFEARRDKFFQVIKYIESKFQDKDKHEVTRWAAEYDIPCGPVNSFKELAHDPSLRKVKTIVEVDHPVRGKYLTIGSPIKFSESEVEITRSPMLGEHSEEVLKSLGYSDAEIAAMVANGTTALYGK
ncbi:MAG: frc 3 [Burkholderiaceae bacterium]|nr:frc 3 [Burkholderiaceae bacterium]